MAGTNPLMQPAMQAALLSATPKINRIAQNTGKILMNSPATAIQPDPSRPIVHVPGEGAVQAGADGRTLYHVITNTPVNAPRNVPFVNAAVKYQYDVLVTRVGTHFGSLGYFIGAEDELQGGIALLMSLIPSAASGLTVTSSYGGNGQLIFSFTDGVNTDTITVQCSQMPYYVLFQKLRTKRYHIPTDRLSYSDATTAESMFSQSVLYYMRRESGGIHTDPMSFIANQTPYQLVIQKVDVNKDFYVSRVEALLSSYIAQAGQTLTHSLQMEYASQLDLHG